ncbi:uncharacterized protein RAG0_16594 [Rhynchosporium agropyri]|uniref:Uncharacterized protein n=1 Tax=Rhynchosporium agropyri TaxID=914238 RepID=A0A1E1LR19_9HELO|nr:uncharacterized protein RAG0_16594 [Rhynchosporium agropyri]
MRILFSQFDENETWPLFSQWSQQSADGGRNIAWQEGFYSCDNFPVMNAFCLTFGFDLLCYGPEDLDPHKRPWMLLELIQGNLGGKYAYDMLDIPAGEGVAEQEVIDLEEDTNREDTVGGLTSDAASHGLRDTAGTTSDDVVQPGAAFIDLILDTAESMDLDEAFRMTDAMDWMSVSAKSAIEDAATSPYPSSPLSASSQPGDLPSRLRRLVPSAYKAIKADFHRSPA